MDFETFQIPLIFVAFFVIASAILSIVYKLGMKEKSYEEALAEQRKNTQLLLGIKQQQPKSKDKKIKKSLNSKKPKDKDTGEKESNDEKGNLKHNSNTVDGASKKDIKASKSALDVKIHPSNAKSKEQLHVPEVSEIEDLSVEKPVVKTNDLQTKGKVVTKKEEGNNKKGISKNTKKEEQQQQSVDRKEKPEVRDASKNENQEQKEKVVKQDETIENVPIYKPINKVSFVQISKKKENEEKSTVIPIVNGYSKDKKKKKNELNALQQLSVAPGMAYVLNVIQKAELSHDDIQVLIDLLLNKQADRTSVLDDWSEGKFDPVQKLKKQLSEKEKALQDEREALTSAQLKLKEIRNERIEERNVYNQKIRALEEQLQNQQLEIHACTQRYHAQSQQLQQTQQQLNDELMNAHALREESAALQLQRQQLEIHVAQESEVIVQLRTEIQEYSARNEQLLIDINHIQKMTTEKEATFVAQMNGIVQESSEKSRQLEELRDILYRQENEFKTELARLNTIIHQQKEEVKKTDELLEEINTLKKQRNISNNLLAKLKADIETLQKEKSQNQVSIVDNNKAKETEILNAKNELASFKNQLKENENKFFAEIETKSDIIAQLENDLEEQKKKNNELRNKNYKIVEALNAAESRINKNEKTINPLIERIECEKKFISRLLPELKGLQEIPSEKWDDESSKLISDYVEGLSKTSTINNEEPKENLQARIEHYQTVIKNTESKLNDLQTQIDEEKISWRAQIKSKDLELDALKEKLEKTQNLGALNGSSVEG